VTWVLNSTTTAAFIKAGFVYSDLKAAASILADAIEAGQKILIVGDFDADGATSTSLWHSLL